MVNLRFRPYLLREGVLQKKQILRRLTNIVAEEMWADQRSPTTIYRKYVVGA